MSAEEACNLGLVNHVVPELELEAKASEILSALRQMSVPALELARRTIVDTTGRSFDDALKHAEDLYLNKLMLLKDPVEGVQAFMNKRPPVWKHK